MGHARALLALQGKEKQLLARKTITSHGLSVRETEKLVKKLAAPASPKKRAKARKDIYIKDIEDRIRRSLGTRVSIQPGGKGGRIEISYYSQDELERLIEQITGER
jgi:ParB family chromosome partitioning protein